MAQHLPPNPSFKYLRLEAKDLHHAFKSGDPETCRILRNLNQLKDKTDSQMLLEAVSLVQMQFALALEYGFESWHALKTYIQTQSLESSDTHASRLKRFTKGTLRKESSVTWLEPIPRFPWNIVRVDDTGKFLFRESENHNYMPLVDSLYCAMRILGENIPYEVVGAASTDIFRFAFEEHWAQDAEYITDIDEIAVACNLLGFDYTLSMGKPLAESLATIENAIQNGQPVLVWGGESRTWHVVVGIDKRRNCYYWVGGWGPDIISARANEAISPWYSLEECPTMPIPTTDWFGCVLGPVQAARNALFVLRKRTSGIRANAINEMLRMALQMNRSRVIERVNFEYRQKSIEGGPSGHDGWKFYFSPWQGAFTMGSEGIREWANVVEQIKEPTNSFEMIHGLDTTFQRQLRKMIIAGRFMHWAAAESSLPIKEHLLNAEKLFLEAGGMDHGLLRRSWDSCRDEKVDEISEAQNLLAFQKEHPALIYLIDDVQKSYLGEKAAHAKNSPWGYRLLPESEVFESAKKDGAESLRKIADLRDKAFCEIEKAIDALDKKEMSACLNIP
jgi:hypothetical protein